MQVILYSQCVVGVEVVLLCMRKLLQLLRSSELRVLWIVGGGGNVVVFVKRWLPSQMALCCCQDISISELYLLSDLVRPVYAT